MTQHTILIENLKTTQNSQMNSAKFQGTKSIYKNQSHFSILTLNITKRI